MTCTSQASKSWVDGAYAMVSGVQSTSLPNLYALPRAGKREYMDISVTTELTGDCLFSLNEKWVNVFNDIPAAPNVSGIFDNTTGQILKLTDLYPEGDPRHIPWGLIGIFEPRIVAVGPFTHNDRQGA